MCLLIQTRLPFGKCGNIAFPPFLTVSHEAVDVNLVSLNALSIRLSFDTGSISEAEVRTFLDHLESTVRFIIDHPESLVCNVELINDREMKLLLSTGMDGELENSHRFWTSHCTLDSDQNVSELIQSQVERTPHKIAVSHSCSIGVIIMIVFLAPIQTRYILDL